MQIGPLTIRPIKKCTAGQISPDTKSLFVPRYNVFATGFLWGAGGIRYLNIFYNTHTQHIRTQVLDKMTYKKKKKGQNIEPNEGGKEPFESIFVC